MSKQPISDTLKDNPASLYDVYVNVADVSEEIRIVHAHVSDSVSKIHQDVANLRQTIAKLDVQIQLLLSEFKGNTNKFDNELKSTVEKRDLKCAIHSGELTRINTAIEDTIEVDKTQNSKIENLQKLVYIGFGILIALNAGMVIFSKFVHQG